jgi:hypothetical protein
MLQLIFLNIALLFFTYCFFSITEWFAHGFIQHGRKKNGLIAGLSRRHLTHHRLTNYDMSLKKNTKLVRDNLDKYQGLYSLWGLILIQNFTFVLLSSYCVPLVFTTSLTIYNFVFYGTLIGMFQSVLWNGLHPSLHSIDRQLTYKEGPDFINRKWFHSTSLHKWLWTNHVIHHLVSGKKQGNYNAALPGADYLFGTYRTSSDCPDFIINSEELTVHKKV